MDPIAIRVWLRDQGQKRYWESSSRSSFKAGSRWKHSYKARYNKNISWWAIVNATVLSDATAIGIFLVCRLC